MAAKIKYTYACPRCDEGVTSKTINTECPKCGLPLGPDSRIPYTPPYTLSEQHHKYDDAELRLAALLAIPTEKALCMLEDAHWIVQTIAGKKASVTDISFMMGLAVKTGAMAQRYLDYLEAGGKHVPALSPDFTTTTTNTTTEESTNELPTPPGDREQTPPRE